MAGINTFPVIRGGFKAKMTQNKIHLAYIEMVFWPVIHAGFMFFVSQIM